MRPLGGLLVVEVTAETVIIVILIVVIDVMMVGAEVHCLQRGLQTFELLPRYVVTQNRLELGAGHPCLSKDVRRLHHDGW